MTEIKKYITMKELADLIDVKLYTLSKYYYLKQDLPTRTALPSGKKIIMIQDYNDWIQRGKKI